MRSIAILPWENCFSGSVSRTHTFTFLYESISLLSFWVFSSSTTISSSSHSPMSITVELSSGGRKDFCAEALASLSCSCNDSRLSYLWKASISLRYLRAKWQFDLISSSKSVCIDFSKRWEYFCRSSKSALIAYCSSASWSNTVVLVVA